MPRFKKGSKEALNWAKKMRESRGKNKDKVSNRTKEEIKKGQKEATKIIKDIEKEDKGEVYCPSCLAKGKKVVMTKRGGDTLVCPICSNPSIAIGEVV